MAIKERKQITGTTEQINAYAGHEGQIVWDKEKKTLVGMSGTAGENYPLAPKEYVDNKVAKCLPLTGGTITVGITSTDSGVIRQATSGNHSLFMGGMGLTDGAYLAVFGKDWVDDRKGGFQLTSCSGYATHSLKGMPNGYLSWDDKEVVTLASRGGDGRKGWIRYTSGIQICWAINVQTNSAGRTSFGFPVPFASAPYVVANLQDSAASKGNWSFIYEDHSSVTTGVNIWLMSNGALSPGQTIKCFAFGLWK